MPATRSWRYELTIRSSGKYAWKRGMRGKGVWEHSELKKTRVAGSAGMAGTGAGWRLPLLRPSWWPAGGDCGLSRKARSVSMPSEAWGLPSRKRVRLMRLMRLKGLPPYRKRLATRRKGCVLCVLCVLRVCRAVQSPYNLPHLSCIPKKVR